MDIQDIQDFWFGVSGDLPLMAHDCTLPLLSGKRCNGIGINMNIYESYPVYPVHPC
ncbi:MAG: hypothetical protein OXN26_06915 [Gammaproteobacteria bacterium]|nr:hypothetical protein [Gammaproteobacteria bacterium]